jgi:thiosulfate dehydrogenase (quinone) large subunit
MSIIADLDEAAAECRRANPADCMLVFRRQSLVPEETPISTTRPAPDAPTGLPAAITTPPPVGDSTRSWTPERAARYVWALTRLCVAGVFLWPFLDKVFGLGHETPSAKAWTNGGNPTKGFLSGSIGPFARVYHDIAGAGWVNWLFMVGLIAIAGSLLLDVFMRLACAAGALLFVLLWSASLPPQDDVFMDNHIIYALLLIGLALVGGGDTFGIGRWWTRANLVRRFARHA